MKSCENEKWIELDNKSRQSRHLQQTLKGSFLEDQKCLFSQDDRRQNYKHFQNQNTLLFRCYSFRINDNDTIWHFAAKL